MLIEAVFAILLFTLNATFVTRMLLDWPKLRVTGVLSYMICP